MSKKPLDLSKCKVGQKVRLRNGEIKIFLGSTLSSLYPFAAGKSIATYGTYTKNGRFNQDREGNIDIVAILPERKTKPAQTGLTAKQRQKLQRALALIEEVLA